MPRMSSHVFSHANLNTRYKFRSDYLLCVVGDYFEVSSYEVLRIVS